MKQSDGMWKFELIGVPDLRTRFHPSQMSPSETIQPMTSDGAVRDDDFVKRKLGHWLGLELGLEK